MTDAQRVLHIRCGDDIKDKLAEAGLAGDYLSFADPAWLGPPPAFNAWLAGRAALIADRTGLPQPKVRAELGEAYWRLARAGGDGDELIVHRCDLDAGQSYKRTTFNFAIHRQPDHYRMIVERKGAMDPP